MQYREFKKLGIKASAFGVGCMRFPTVEVNGERVVDLENAKNIIRRAIDAGVNYVDTAYNYSQKTNELRLSRTATVSAFSLPQSFLHSFVSVPRICSASLTSSSKSSVPTTLISTSFTRSTEQAGTR